MNAIVAGLERLALRLPLAPYFWAGFALGILALAVVLTYAIILST